MFQGEIIIEDEEEEERGKVKFEVFRISSSESEALAIIINHTVVDMGSGNVVLFQVVQLRVAPLFCSFVLDDVLVHLSFCLFQLSPAMLIYSAPITFELLLQVSQINHC